MAERIYLADLPWVAIVFGIACAFGLGAGFVFGYEGGVGEAEVREELRERCLAGNDRACAIYEQDYSRGGFW